MQGRYWAALVILLGTGAFYFLTDHDESSQKVSQQNHAAPRATITDPQSLSHAPSSASSTTAPATRTASTDFESLLEKLKKGEAIDRETVLATIELLQKEGVNHQRHYDKMAGLYRSGIPEGSRIFLARMLGEIQTPEATRVLLSLLDVPAEPQVVYENRRAIDDLVFDNVEGQPNVELSPVLMEYWNTTDSDLYRADIAQAIAKLGHESEVSSLVQALNNPSQQQNTQEAVSSSMKQIRSTEATAVLVHSYFDDGSTDTLKTASLEAMPYIANETAVNFLYEWSATLSTTEEIAAMQEYLEVLLQRNPDAEGIIKEHFYADKVTFTSDAAKAALEAAVKNSN